MHMFYKTNHIFTRPNTSSGFWLMFLLPTAILASYIKHPLILTPTYKLAALFSFGLILSSASLIDQCRKNQILNAFNFLNVIANLFTAFLFHFCFDKGLLFSLLSAVISTIVYQKLYHIVLKKFPQCFTLGEAAIVTQGFLILLYFTAQTVINADQRSYTNNSQIATVIIQVGLLGVTIIAGAIFKFNIRTPSTFYYLSALVLFFVIFLPLHVLLGRSPVLWILEWILLDEPTLKLVIYWSACSAVGALAISRQIFQAKKATTSTRKIFHILSIVVFLPGLLFRCSFLYLATGVVLGVFCGLEIVRVSQISPLGTTLQDGFVVFSDEKDTGALALTPLYLLAGCSLPLWIHPGPCDLTDSAIFNLLPLLSGLLSIGIGDTFASIVGSNFGKHHWNGSKKTIEGTLACVLSQFLFIELLIFAGCITHLTDIGYLRLFLAIIITSVVEAKTDQVDNLVLPLIMYIILI